MNTHIEGVEMSAYLDGALDAPARARAGAHAAACVDCRRELDALRHMKSVLAAAPRRTMPADLALALERRLVAGVPWWKTAFQPVLWVPAGAVAAAALAIGLWMRQARVADELPLEPLLAAHARYSAEVLVPDDHLVASNYSDQLTAQYEDASDSELQ